MRKQFFIAVLVLNVILSFVFYLISTIYPDFKFITLEVANTVMAVLCLASYILVNNNITDRPQAFVRGVNSASLLKLIVCMVAILVYVLIYRSKIHKPSIFIFFGIYMVYTGLETWILQKIARENKNNQ